MVVTGREADLDETANLIELIAEVVRDPGVWMDSPHDLLGGRRPEESLGTDREVLLRDLARSSKIGMAS